MNTTANTAEGLGKAIKNDAPEIKIEGQGKRR